MESEPAEAAADAELPAPAAAGGRPTDAVAADVDAAAVADAAEHVTVEFVTINALKQPVEPVQLT